MFLLRKLCDIAEPHHELAVLVYAERNGKHLGHDVAVGGRDELDAIARRGIVLQQHLPVKEYRREEAHVQRTLKAWNVAIVIRIIEERNLREAKIFIELATYYLDRRNTSLACPPVTLGDRETRAVRQVILFASIAAQNGKARNADINPGNVLPKIHKCEIKMLVAGLAVKPLHMAL